MCKRKDYSVSFNNLYSEKHFKTPFIHLAAIAERGTYGYGGTKRFIVLLVLLQKQKNISIQIQSSTFNVKHAESRPQQKYPFIGISRCFIKNKQPISHKTTS